MNEAAAVDGVQRVRQLLGNVEQPVAGERTARDDVVERSPLEQFADQERLAGFLDATTGRPCVCWPALA